MMMSREKQVEEIAKIICAKCKSDTACERVICTMAYREAEELHQKGYRKSEEVAREIFEEIEEIVIEYDLFGRTLLMIGQGTLAELKKKYTETTEDGNERSKKML